MYILYYVEDKFSIPSYQMSALYPSAVLHECEELLRSELDSDYFVLALYPFPVAYTIQNFIDKFKEIKL